LWFRLYHGGQRFYKLESLTSYLHIPVDIFPDHDLGSDNLYWHCLRVASTGCHHQPQ
jgi:hypothetical protein